MTKKKTIPAIHVPIQRPDGSMEWVWYMFLQWVADNTGKIDLSDYFTKEETEDLLDDKVDKTTYPNKIYGTDEDGEQTVYDADGLSVAIDDLTITKNDDNELQTVAKVNQNAETGATNPIYDWVGTLEEYEDQNIETLHPDWMCYIVDDMEPTPTPTRREVAERNIGEIIYSLIPVVDGGLHLLDGECLPGEGIYADFYNHMVDIYATAPQIFCSEADWQTSVATYGVCGKFVLDTEGISIRLPKVTGFVEGTIIASEIGGLVEAGLPNITGTFQKDQISVQDPYEATGCVKEVTSLQGYSVQAGSSGNGIYRVTIDASGSSSVYGNSTTVQPQAVKGYIYMVIANTVKTDITVDIDEIATDLNNKVTKGHEEIAFQAPTAANNYTWYRKYADGWVEQGGYVSQTSWDVNTSVVLPLAMANSNYTILTTLRNNNSNAGFSNVDNTVGITTTGFYFRIVNKYNNACSPLGVFWQVSGMAA